MTPEIARLLRAPFPPEVIGKLPRVWCKACQVATREDKRPAACQQHTMIRCEQCKTRITSGHLHLDYVGHAETTDRLLEADPEWTWEPLAFGPDGLPVVDRHGGLWIRLTVAGVTRLGYGHAEGKTGPDAVKETIGDAIRNAAMRFGVALDLWGATPKHDEPSGTDSEQVEQRRQTILANARREIGAADSRDGLEEIRSRIGRAVDHGVIIEQDAVELRRLWVQRMEALQPTEQLVQQDETQETQP